MIYYSVEFFCLTYYLCFFNDTVTTEIYTLSLHDSLRICVGIAFEEAHAARGDAQDLVALGELEGADQGLDVEGVGDLGEGAGGSADLDDIVVIGGDEERQSFAVAFP